MSGEELEVLGKHAACKYLTGACNTLSDAIVETVKSAGLSPEQVKRVIEFANTDAYLQEFKKEGTDHKYIHFHGGPANPSEVLKDLNDGGGGSVFDRGVSDYNQPPDLEKSSSVLLQSNRQRLGVKTASVYNPAEQQLEQLFAVKEQPLPYADPWEESVAMREKLAGARDHLNSELSSLEIEYMDVCDHMYHLVKQAALNDVPLGHIIQAWADVVPGENYVKLAFARVGPRLMADGVFLSRVALGESLTKTASGMPDHSHPLIRTFAAFCTYLDKMASVRASRDEVNDAFGRIDWFLREGMKKHADSLVGVLGKVHRGAKGLSRRAAPVVEKAIGGTPGVVAGKVVEHTPEALEAALLYEGYNRLKYSPSTAGLVRGVKSWIPGTTENYMARRERMGI